MTFEAFAASIKTISTSIIDDGFHPTALVAIARGGWIPARLLSKYLGVKRLYSFGVTYADDSRTELMTYDSPHPELREQKILLIEDFLESGRSMKHCAEQLSILKNTVKTFAVGYSNKSLIVPDYTSGLMSTIPQLPWD